MKRFCVIAGITVLCAVLIAQVQVPVELETYRNRMQSLAQAIRPGLVKVDVRYSPRKLGFLGDSVTTQRGAGFIIDEDHGYIVTASQTVSGYSAVKVTLSDGRTFEGKVIGMDELTDVTLLRIPPDQLTGVTLANSDDLKIGEPLLGIGINSSGVPAPTFGILSSLPTAGPWAEGGLSTFVQTDMAMAYGFQGGPLLNFKGEVVGMMSLLRREAKNFYLHFAIPANTLRKITGQMAQFGRFIRPWVGLNMLAVDRPVIEKYGYPYRYGMYVSYTEPGSPAAEAGIQEEDFILELNGARLSDENSFWLTINHMEVGQSFELLVWRNGSLFKKTVAISGRKNQGGV
ncbi:MAG: S1C family serine protease [bacterium]